MGLLAALPCRAELSNESWFGPGMRSQPAYDGSASQRLQLVPVVRVFGDPWFLRTTQDVLEAGARAQVLPGLDLASQVAYEPGRKASESAFLASHHVADVDDLLVFDAIDYGLEPGEMKLVRDEEVPKFTGAKKMSLHQTGFQEVLSAADLLGHYPKRLALIGCQPQDLEDWGGPLTAPVRAQLSPAIRLAFKILGDWGYEIEARAPEDSAPGLLAHDIDFLNYERRTPAPAPAGA